MSQQRSDFYAGVNYQTTRHGRAAYGDMGFEMFPEKYEDTASTLASSGLPGQSPTGQLIEDPEQLYVDRRDTLRDFSPDRPMLESDLPRRRTWARERLNLADGGSRGPGTDPYHDEDYDTQFHDKDPRGWSTETPWREYRRLAEAHATSLPYSSEAEGSVTSGGIHPNTLYQRIRHMQTDLKARWKNFEDEKQGYHAGGVGFYPHVSHVFDSDVEHHHVGGDLLSTFEDPENRQRSTSALSNEVHLGGNFIRADSTTDHRVKTSGYANLVRDRGLIPSETSYRLLEGETPDITRGEKTRVNAQKQRMLSTALQEHGAVDPITAAQSARILLQMAGSNEDRRTGRSEERANVKAASMGDIMSLLGVQDGDMKKMRQDLSSPDGKTRRAAEMKLANVQTMLDYMQQVPSSELSKTRDMMAVRSVTKHMEHVASLAGGGNRGGRNKAGNNKPADMFRKGHLLKDLIQKKANVKVEGTRAFDTGEMAENLENRNYVAMSQQDTDVRGLLNEAMRQDEEDPVRDRYAKRHGGRIGTKYTSRLIDREMSHEKDT